MGTLSPSTRPTSTSVCFSTLRDASCSTVLTTTSSLTRTPSSFAVSTGLLSVPRASLPSPRKMADIIKFETGATCVVTKGKNNGRMGTITSRDKHPGGFDIVNIKDAKGKAFATRIGNIFCVGKKDEGNMISVPKGRGIKENILEERKKRFGY